MTWGLGWNRSHSRIPFLSFLSTSQTIQKDKMQFLWISHTNSLLTLKSAQFLSYRNLHSAPNPKSLPHKYSQYPIIPQISFNSAFPLSQPTFQTSLHLQKILPSPQGPKPKQFPPKLPSQCCNLLICEPPTLLVDDEEFVPQLTWFHTETFKENVWRKRILGLRGRKCSREGKSPKYLIYA